MPAKVAFFDFAGCEGCQLTVIDALQTHSELLEAVEIVQFREASSRRDDDYQIAFVEGACARPSDEDRLRAIRSQAQIVIALGACAHLGGVNALRNRQPLAEARRVVYGENGGGRDCYDPRPISAVIPVDGCLPGCPIDAAELLRTVRNLLQGRNPQLPDYPVCAECRLRENVCLAARGGFCLGSVVRAGCGAICPTAAVGCDGCRGLLPDANLDWLRAALAERGVTDETFDAHLGLFLTYEMMNKEAATHERHH
jgi:coenzyme F420-reducing hydrogenase gamma subunit